jgi:hypothetical protein
MDIETTEAWAAFVDMRRAKGKRAPFTDLARKRILFELRRMQADGQDAEEVLWTSVTNGWSGVFPIRRKGWAPAEVAHTPDKRAEQFTLAMQERAQTRSAPPPGLRTRVARGLLADREDDQ